MPTQWYTGYDGIEYPIEVQERSVEQSIVRLTTVQMIEYARTMPIVNEAWYAVVGTAKFHLWRAFNNEWVIAMYDSTKPVSDEDEKYYKNPAYIRGFLSNRVTWKSNVDAIEWTSQSPYDKGSHGADYVMREDLP